MHNRAMNHLETLVSHLEQYERLVQRAIDMDACIREEDPGIAISDSHWEVVYATIFRTSPIVYAALRQLGTRLEYLDPDSTYETDIRAYVHALREKVDCLNRTVETKTTTAANPGRRVAHVGARSPL